MRRRPHSPLATRTPSVGPCFVATRLEVFADLQHGRSHRFFESTVAREPVESIEHLARLACANLTITSHALDLFGADKNVRRLIRSEEHTSELQSLMRISYAVFCLKKKK